MSNTPRDTQFAGFAEKLSQEIHDMACSFTIFPGAYVLKRMECEIIARRAYDLVMHTLWNVASIDMETLFIDEMAAKVPDLTELPKEQEA